eukprot:scaffold185844_cov23-Prasinocladus_malaysianus.AAC.1
MVAADVPAVPREGVELRAEMKADNLSLMLAWQERVGCNKKPVLQRPGRVVSSTVDYQQV